MGKLVFVAGPYTAKTSWGEEMHIKQAQLAGIKLLKMGYVPVIPHSMYAHFDGECEYKVFLEATKSLLTVCKAVLVVGKWEFSAGVQEELKLAKELGIPVFLHPEDIEAADSVIEEIRVEL